MVSQLFQTSDIIKICVLFSKILMTNYSIRDHKVFKNAEIIVVGVILSYFTVKRVRMT